jgi:hypothetical protein
MWITLEVTNLLFHRQAYQKAAAIVVEMGGSIVRAGSIDDLVVLARFPHRQYRSVEKAVAAAVSTLPVERTSVYGQNPFGLRKPPGQCRRRDGAGEEPQRTPITDILFEAEERPCPRLSL